MIFRQRNKETKDFHYWGLIDRKWINPVKDTNYVSPELSHRYIGINDSSQNKIFENDILSQFINNEGIHQSFRIEWCDKSLMFIGRNILTNQICSLPTIGLITNIVTSNLYQHDCSSCIYLGSYDKRDLYFCGKKGLSEDNKRLEIDSTIVSRYGEEGSNYGSGISFAQRAYYKLQAGYDPQTFNNSLAVGYAKALELDFIIKIDDFVCMENGERII